MDRAPALITGLKVLERVSNASETVPLESFFEDMDMSDSSIKRLVSVMVQSGYLERLASKKGYRPGPRLLTLSHSCYHNWSARDDFYEHMQELSDEMGLSLQYGILDRIEKRVIVQHATLSESSLYVQGVNTELTHRCHRHALSKAILAFTEEPLRHEIIAKCDMRKLTEHTLEPGPELDLALTRIAELGHAEDREEYRKATFRIALPIFDTQGKVIAALCATWVEATWNEDFSQQILAKLELLKKKHK